MNKYFIVVNDYEAEPYIVDAATPQKAIEYIIDEEWIYPDEDTLFTVYEAKLKVRKFRSLPTVIVTEVKV